MKLQLRWRLIAMVALASYIAISVALVSLILHNLLLVAAWWVTTIGLCYAFWLLFTGVGRRKRRGLVLVGLALVAWFIEFSLLARQSDLIRVFIVVGFVVSLYLILVSLLRKQYWLSERAFHQPAKALGQFQKPYLIINPKAGNGRATKAHLADHAEQLGIETILLSQGDNIEALARQAVEQGADVLGISGGDGSIGAVAKVAIEQDLPLVVLAGGTRCHFARDLGLSPAQIVDGLAGFSGVERRIDIGEINSRLFLNNASFGLYADIVDQPGYREHKVAMTRKVLTDILAGRTLGYQLKFSHQQHRFDSAVQILVGVNRYQTINVLEFGQREALDQGVLQITVITRLNDQLVKQLVGTLSLPTPSSLTSLDGVEQWEVTEFEIANADGSIVAGVDGERLTFDSPINIKIRPGALRVFVPPEGIRNRPINPLRLSATRRLWRIIWGRPIE